MKQIIALGTLLLVILSSYAQSKLVNNSIRIPNPYSSTMAIKLVGEANAYLIAGAKSAAWYENKEITPDNYRRIYIRWEYDENCFKRDIANIASSMQTEAAIMELLSQWSEEKRKKDPDSFLGNIFPLIIDPDINPIKRKRFEISERIKHRYDQWLTNLVLDDAIRETILDAMELVQLAENVNLPKYSNRVDEIVRLILVKPTYERPLSDFITTIRITRLQLEVGKTIENTYLFASPLKTISLAGTSTHLYYAGSLNLFLRKPLQIGRLFFNQLTFNFESTPLLYAQNGDSTALISNRKAVAYNNAGIALCIAPLSFYSLNTELKPFISFGYSLSLRNTYSIKVDSESKISEKKHQNTILESGRALFSLGVQLRHKNVFLKATLLYNGLASPFKDFRSQYLRSTKSGSFSIAFPLVLSKGMLRYK